MAQEFERGKMMERREDQNKTMRGEGNKEESRRKRRGGRSSPRLIVTEFGTVG
jgi:hypothetical protein